MPRELAGRVRQRGFGSGVKSRLEITDNVKGDEFRALNDSTFV